MYDAVPAPWRRVVLIVSCAVLLSAVLHGAIVIAVAALAVAGTIIYTTIKEPDSDVSLQADKRDRDRAKAQNTLVSALVAAGYIDDDTMDGMVSVECLDAGDPMVFRVQARQPGKTEQQLQRATADAVLALDARYCSIARVEDEASVYRITYSRRSEYEVLADMRITYADIRQGVIMRISRLPIGRYADGTLACANLDSRNALINGNPRSGKSVLLSVLICDLLRCDNELLAIASPKSLDFAVFASSPAVRLIQATDDILAHLDWLVSESERRKRHCEDSGAKKITPSAEYPHITTVIDEYTVIKLLEPQVEQRVMRLVAETGFAGFAFVVATQRVSSRNISTDLRDLIAGNRISMATETAESDKMIFGDLAPLAPCHQIGADQRGVGYASFDGRDPRAIKCAITSRDDELLAARLAKSDWSRYV